MWGVINKVKWRAKNYDLEKEGRHERRHEENLDRVKLGN